MYPAVSVFPEILQVSPAPPVAPLPEFTAQCVTVENPPEPPKHDVRTLLQESVEFERRGLAGYKALLKLVGDDIALEELVREQIKAETEHIEEIEKMLRGPEK